MNFIPLKTYEIVVLPYKNAMELNFMIPWKYEIEKAVENIRF